MSVPTLLSSEKTMTSLPLTSFSMQKTIVVYSLAMSSGSVGNEAVVCLGVCPPMQEAWLIQ